MSISIFAVGVGKLVVIIFLLRVQGPTHTRKRWFLYFMAASNVSSAIEAETLNKTHLCDVCEDKTVAHFMLIARAI